MDDEDVRLRRARLGSLLATLQSVDFFIESLAPWWPGGERVAGLPIVTLLEAWKAACRLRLVGTLERGELLRSFTPEASDPEQLGDVVRRLRKSLSPRVLPPPVRSARGRAAATALYLGEVMHAIQPLVYVGLLLAQARGVRSLASGWRRRLPWLSALVLEVVSLRLCTLGVRELTAGRSLQESTCVSTSELMAGRLRMLPVVTWLGAVLGVPVTHHDRRSANRTFDGPHARANQLELDHRRMLVKLFVLRPAACAAIRAVLVRLMAAANRRVSRGSGVSGFAAGLLRAVCVSALEMIELLETQLWARYYRTAEGRLT